jgi:hypothetical protein
MLLILWRAGYLELEPPPPKTPLTAESESAAGERGALAPRESPAAPSVGDVLRGLTPPARLFPDAKPEAPPPDVPAYKPRLAHPTPSLEKLLLLRGINPLYGMFLVNQLGIADRRERLQAMESVLEIPRSLRYQVRVPPPEELPPGPLATTRLDVQLLQLGLASAEELGAGQPEDEEDERDRRRWSMFAEERPRVLTLADKLRRLFDYDFPGVHDVSTEPVWAAGELLEFGGDFNTYVTSKGLQKQEGIIFRHTLRLILLAYEFTQFVPPDVTEDEWLDDLEDIAARLAAACRKVDPDSTDKTLQEAALWADEGQP